MIRLKIDDKKIELQEDLTIFQAAEQNDIKIPTLCSHKALSPYGACRLCIVEIRQNGRSMMQASCTYPALEGLVVRTNSERVIKTRKLMIELLLARCPESEQIRTMAAELGVTETRIKSKDKDCTLCGLCVRMCKERMGRAAISFAGRGPRREVTTPFGMQNEVCQTCGACAFICPTGRIKLTDISKNKPVPILSEYNKGLNTRGAVYIPYPQAIPNRSVIDSKNCIHLLTGECGICKELCEADAIDYEQKETTIDLNVGSIILASGFDLYNAHLSGEYGMGRFPNVVTSLQYERILSPSGPYGGHLKRPSDGIEPRRIAWIQCIGSRRADRNWCSAVCCMYATKQAIITKEHAPGTECTVFYIDFRAYGKGFDAYYERARQTGTRYLQVMPSTIKEKPATRNLEIQYILPDGQEVTETFDMVVLSVGVQPPESMAQLANEIDVSLTPDGFCKTADLLPLNTTRKGIFVCGPFAEPKDIPETVMSASASAAKAMTLLAEVRHTLIQPKEYLPEIDVSGQEPLVGVFVCHCGTNIAAVVDVEKVTEYASSLPNVVVAEHHLFTCSTDTQARIREAIKEHNLNRVVVASCTPRTHEPVFQNTIREAGLNFYLLELANIRDHCSWVHREHPEAATEKAKDLVRMAVAKVRLVEPIERMSIEFNHNALVIGGGLAGMTAALELADQGFKVSVIERQEELGGNMRQVRFLLTQAKPQKLLQDMVQRTLNHPNIHSFLNAKIAGFEGSLGNFKTTLHPIGPGSAPVINHGVVIVATGAQPYQPTEYLYGQDERILTQLELESVLADQPAEIEKLKTLVMIQCVGSRIAERPYCSRLCCGQAVKNALMIRKVSPQTEVYVLYRDIRTYGLLEPFYRQAREAGVIFLRFEAENAPQVTASDDLQVVVHDAMLNTDVVLNADRVVLSVATVPRPDADQLAKLLKVPRTQDGFFLEAHMKLRPVDFATDGIYLCGMAHYPKKAVTESVIQATAAASRAATILAKDRIELDAIVSHVVDNNCDGCAYCIDPCPYGALTLIEYMKDGSIKKTVERDLALCKGCGSCQATCPKNGIFVANFKLTQLQAMVDAALESG